MRAFGMNLGALFSLVLCASLGYREGCGKNISLRLTRIYLLHSGSI